jgi:hypothetical protein
MPLRNIFVAATFAVLVSANAWAQPAADHYQGKQIRLIVGHGVGADYDIGARLLAKHLARHIPGQPTIIVQNMPGAGSTIAANYLFSQAAKDGTVFGSFSRNLPSQAVLGNARIKSDPRKFNRDAQGDGRRRQRPGTDRGSGADEGRHALHPAGADRSAAGEPLRHAA